MKVNFGAFSPGLSKYFDFDKGKGPGVWIDTLQHVYRNPRLYILQHGKHFNPGSFRRCASGLG